MADRKRPDRTEGDPQPRDWAPLVGALVLLLAVAVFVLQNNDRVDIEFLFVEGRLPLGVALLLSAVIGGLISVLLGFVRHARHRLGGRR